jgi:hypothetical protein
MLGPCHGYCFDEVPVVTAGVGKASKRQQLRAFAR